MRALATYTLIVAITLIVVLNPVVIYLVTANRGFSLYMVVLDFWLLLIAIAAALYLRGGQRVFGWAIGALVVTLLPALLIGEAAFIYLRHSVGANLIEQVDDIHQPDDMLIYTIRPGMTGRHAKAGDFDVEYVMDDRGRKLIPQAPDAERTVHVFGDSFTFGYGVANADTWLNLANDELGGRINILNYGVVGYSLEQMYLSLERSIDAIAPGDLVIFAPMVADLERGLAGRMYVCGGLIRTEANDHFPKLVEGEWVSVPLRDECDFLWDTVLANSTFPVGFGAAYRSLQKDDLYQAIVASADRLFAAAAALVSTRDASFELVFLPTPEECATRTWSVALDGLETPYRSLMAYCPKDPAEAPGLRFVHDGHWNPKGHQWAAAAFLAELEAIKGAASP